MEDGFAAGSGGEEEANLFLVSVINDCHGVQVRDAQHQHASKQPRDHASPRAHEGG